MAEEYDFEKLAREIVASQWPQIEPGKGPQAAARLAKQSLISGVQATKLRQEPQKTVRAVCRGVISGVLLAGGSLPETAACILSEMAAVADETALSPQDLMTWSMEGIAQAAQIAGADVQSKIQDAIEARFMGAGSVFGDICRTLLPAS